MHRIKKLALATIAGLFCGAVSAQTAIDFHGESTFRGYIGGVELDNPVQPKSNPNFTWMSTGLDLPDYAGNHANVPRRTVERFISGGHPVAKHNAARSNFAVSGTRVENMLSGAVGNSGKRIEILSGGTDSAIAVINTGINDAVGSPATTPSLFRAQLQEVTKRLLLTGKKVVILKPNALQSAAGNNLLNQFYSGLDVYLYQQGPQLYDSSNVRIVHTNVGTSDSGSDGVHPSRLGYETMSAALYNAIRTSPSFLADAELERKVAQDYVLFFNRAVESGGAAYWLGELRLRGEAYVTQAMFHAAPEYRGLTPVETVNKWYANLFRQAPDAEGLNFWVSRINNAGVGVAAVEMLNAVRNYGYNVGDPHQSGSGTTTPAQAVHKKMLVHRTNVGVAYGFRLKRAAVDTSGMMASITTDPATVYNAMQYK